MTYHEPTQTATHRTRLIIFLASVVVGTVLMAFAAAFLAVLDDNSMPMETGRGFDPPLQQDRRARGNPAIPLGATDGAVPEGVTVFDNDIPAVANLNPDLLNALRQAATDANRDGVEFYVNSGWRSAPYQEQLLRDAIATYGSEAEAARWVAAAERSTHVSGDAVDIGSFDATAWLAEHGAEYGLCQIYSNEPWHYELRPEAIYQGCPPMYADPTHDPRMQP